MSLAILLAAGAGVMFALLSLVYKYADIHKCRFAHFSFMCSFIAAIFSFMPTLWQSTVWSSAPLWGWSAILGAVTVTGIFVLMFANQAGPVYVNWTIINVSFMLAIFLSAIIFKETVLLVDFINLALFAVVLFLFAHGIRKGADPQKVIQPLRYIIILLMVFLTNGLATFGGKIKFMYVGENNTAAFTCLLYVFAALLTIPFIIRDKKFFSRAEIMAGAMAGFCFSAGTILFYAAMNAPATAVFPTTQGVSLIGGVLLTTIVAKEKLNGWTLAGIVLGGIVLAMVVMRLQINTWL